MMRKFAYLLLIYLTTLPSLRAQQQYYDWFISAGAGGMGYYGDLSYKINTARINAPAYQVSIGCNLSPSLAIILQGALGKISANDRARDWKGNLRTDNLNFSRALNFQTDIRSAQLLVNYRLNNGHVLSKHARIAPYLYGGIGITDFTVFGDLYNQDGGRYYYWSDNTIRNQPQVPANAGTAQIIRQDGKFETNLSQLNTEQTYPTSAWSIPAGAGLSLQISDRVSANLQAGANYVFSGYLDDVNGNYRNEYASPEQAYAANPSGILRDKRGNGSQDVYLSAFLSLTYHFNFSKKSFQAPMVYTGYSPAQPLAYKNDREPATDTEQINDAKPADTEPADDAEQSNDSKPATESLPSGTATSSSDQLTDQATNPAKTPVIKPDTVYITNNRDSFQRQTVDINLRIQVEGGKADTVYTPASAEKYNQKALPYPNTDTITLSDQKANPPQSITRKDTLYLANRQQISATGPALYKEFYQMRKELDSLKSVQQTANNFQPNPATDQDTHDLNTISGQQLSPEPQDAENKRILALEQEVDRLSNALAQERASRLAGNTSSPDITIRNVPPASQTAKPVTQYTAPIPLLAEKDYTSADMASLRKQVDTLQLSLQNLKIQQQTAADSLVENRIDSLMQLIKRIESMAATPEKSSVSPVPAPQPEQAIASHLIDSLQRQVIGLNRSLVSMQSRMASRIDSLSAGVPLSALGSTVVYYDINTSELKEADKQRLAVLGEKIKNNPSAMVHIKGFTDQTGNAAYNLALSRKRAETVKNYLISQVGIRPGQILINYFGQQQASSDKANPYDRKVEVELFRE